MSTWAKTRRLKGRQRICPSVTREVSWFSLCSRLQSQRKTHFANSRMNDFMKDDVLKTDEKRKPRRDRKLSHRYDEQKRRRGSKWDRFLSFAETRRLFRSITHSSNWVSEGDIPSFELSFELSSTCFFTVIDLEAASSVTVPLLTSLGESVLIDGKKSDAAQSSCETAILSLLTSLLLFISHSILDVYPIF